MNPTVVPLTQFLTDYPEFAKSDPNVVQRCLNDASVEVDATVYSEKANSAAEALAAHYLQLSPLGQGTRLRANTTETTYWRHYVNIRDSLGLGVTVSRGRPALGGWGGWGCW